LAAMLLVPLALDLVAFFGFIALCTHLVRGRRRWMTVLIACEVIGLFALHVLLLRRSA
jgi:hypothetical protein